MPRRYDAYILTQPSIPPSNRERWRAFAVAVIVAGFALMDGSKVIVALGSIERSIHADPTSLQLIVAGYMLTFGVALVPAGRFGDLHSRRRVFLLGLVLFGFTSLLLTFAPSAPLMVVGRLVQGASAGLILPQVVGIIQQLFTGRERGKAFGLFGAIISGSVAFAPTLGGGLVALGGPELGWRLMFLINVPVVVIAIPIAVKLLPRHQERIDGARQLDLFGTLLLGLTTLGVMLPFVLTTGRATDDPRRWLLLLVAVALGTAFAFWERRYAASGRLPLVDFALFRIAPFRNGFVITFLFIGAVPATVFATAMFLEQGVAISAIITGVVITPLTLFAALTSVASGRLVYRFGRRLVVGGLLVMIMGFGCIVLAAQQSATVIPFGIAGALALTGLGMGVVSPANQTLMLERVPVQQGGLAGSIGQVAQRLGTAIGMAFAAAVFTATIAARTAELGVLDAGRAAYSITVLSLSVLLVTAAGFGVADVVSGRRLRPDAA